ncbi:MAG: hypothetical protein A2007_05055 [Verrucomicrobia bacterium GWC2_42_7]|nr:MAG: hypothetical protein A2007_05055 [Verrucomicrobia bacterium GWC2_42_7]
MQNAVLEQKSVEYMNNIHEYDYQVNNTNWETTLYSPLRNYLLKTLMDNFDNSEKIHLVYIGVGPRAPLFQNQQINNILLKRIREITLIDISHDFIKSSKSLLEKISKNIPINIVQADITMGLAAKFDKIINKVFSNFRKHNLQDIADLVSQMEMDKNNHSLADLFNSQNIKSADLVYSEMVATFTGTPIMFALENKLRAIPDSDISHQDFLKSAYLAWQIFNDKSFDAQINNYLSITNKQGLIAISGDTQKVFIDHEKSPIPTFFSNQENFPTFTRNDIKLKASYAPIWWKDVSRDENIDFHVGAHDQHAHKVAFNTYLRLS